MRPIVAVTIDRRAAGPAPAAPPGRQRPPLPEVYGKAAVVQAIRSAGMEPVLLPPHGQDPGDLLDWTMRSCAGVVITGGAFDIHPSLYGKAVTGRLDRVDAARTGLELALARRCLDEGLPLLGLCGGLQALAVAAGGTLVQDIASDLAHEQDAPPTEASHPVRLTAGHLRDAAGVDTLRVNSTHHQAIWEPGDLRITGRAPDGVVEAAEHAAHPFALGVQWHPELLDDDAAGRAPFRALCEAIHREAGRQRF
jgi:putative glutamine amidotransferase